METTLSSQIIFGKKTLSDILEDIYKNSKNKEKQISTLLSNIAPLITNIGEANLIIPLIQEYIGLSIKNDESLIKLAAIIQRAVSNNGSSTDSVISDEERRQLLKEIKISTVN